MGLAMAAETNGYPGPRHVLEMADQIGLTAAQRARVEQIFSAMQAEARRLGAQLLAKEAELNDLFRHRRATPASLTAAAGEIATTEAALRTTHLSTHLMMMDVLSPDQMSRYVALRRAGAGSGRTRPGQEPPTSSHNH